jgi:hypothetical protein
VYAAAIVSLYHANNFQERGITEPKEKKELNEIKKNLKTFQSL